MNKTKSPTKTKPAFIGLNIEHNQYVDIHKDSDPDMEFGHSSTTTWTIGSRLTLCADNETPDIISSIDFVDGKEYFLVYAISSTGDSFSHQRDASCMFIDVFENAETANELARKIKDHHAQYLENTSLVNYKPFIKYKDEKGLIRQIPCDDWNGYFESLSCCEVIPVVANKPSCSDLSRMKIH